MTALSIPVRRSQTPRSAQMRRVAQTLGWAVGMALTFAVLVASLHFVPVAGGSGLELAVPAPLTAPAPLATSAPVPAPAALSGPAPLPAPAP